MTIRINEDYLPLIIEEYEGPTTDEDAVGHRKVVCDVLERGERYGVLYDLRYGSAMSQDQRRIDAQFIKDNRETLEDLVIGVAFVVPTALLRIAMNFLLFLAPLPMPYVSTRSVSEAMEWLEERFKEAGVAIPDGAAEYVRQLEQHKAA